MNDRIIVGFDGSRSSFAAVEWAAREAAVRQAQLSILSCVTPPTDAGKGCGEAIAELLCTRHPHIVCDATTVVGAPREALVEASAAADLLVVGKTGTGAIKTLILGSVANSVVRRSQCPSVLVPTPPIDRETTGVVAVGVDGSPASVAALEWAVAEAEVRDARLLLVHAWTFEFSGPVAESTPFYEAARREAEEFVQHTVARVRSCAGDVTVNGTLAENRPAAALLDQASSVDLIVVGSRGRGSVRSMLLGSVAHALTEHATCPTVVVRHG